MPWIKYRSFEEAERALWTAEPGPERWKRVAELWAVSRRMAPRRFSSGVFKYRSIEEAQAEREEWIAQQAKLLRETRQKTG